MNTENIINLISEQFKVDEEKIYLDTSFKNDLNADSLDIVELIMALEDEYGLEIDDEDVEGISTVGDAINYIIKALGEDI